MESDDETKQILRDLWREMVAVRTTLSRDITQLGATLSERISGVEHRISSVEDSLSSRIDETNRELKLFRTQTQDNFARTQRNFDRIHTRLESLEGERGRIDDLDERLTRVETHVGLRDDE